jgi:hypothetical protein
MKCATRVGSPRDQRMMAPSSQAGTTYCSPSHCQACQFSVFTMISSWLAMLISSQKQQHQFGARLKPAK